MKDIVYLTDKLEGFTGSDEMLNAHYRSLMESHATLRQVALSPPKYFNEETLSHSSVSMVDFHNETEIGKTDKPLPAPPVPNLITNKTKRIR